MVVFLLVLGVVIFFILLLVGGDDKHQEEAQKLADKAQREVVQQALLAAQRAQEQKAAAQREQEEKTKREQQATEAKRKAEADALAAAKRQQEEESARRREQQEAEAKRKAETLAATKRQQEQEAVRLREQQEAESRKRLEADMRAAREAERIQNEQKRQQDLAATALATQAQRLQQLNLPRYNDIKDALMQAQLKSDAEEILEILRQNNITYLYHFTDRENLHSIKAHQALVSWGACESEGIKIPRQGGGSLSRNLDQRDGLSDYVRLSFASNHPMRYIAQNEGRISNPVLLRVDPAVCLLQGTKFCNMNATKTGRRLGSSPADLQAVKFALVKLSKHFDIENEDERKYYQAEVLVKQKLAAVFITNLDHF
jgi:outer membrane biosynthesis protein TonB